MKEKTEIVKTKEVLKGDYKLLPKPKIGRPLKFPSPINFEKQINEYLDYCVENKQPLTVSGMCLYLGTTRETLSDYRNKPEYADSIKRAKLTIAHYVETGLLTGRINPIASIFHLTNLDPDNWKQKQEVSHSGSIALGIAQLPSRD